LHRGERFGLYRRESRRIDCEEAMPSLIDEENAASDQILQDLKDHLNYANDVYNLIFKVQSQIAGRRLSDLSDTTWAQLMILMRISDYLRSIQLLAIKGYPEQAGTLTASIFELAHTAAYFGQEPDKAKVWLDANSIEEEMP
jgi:hypothetical protein